MMQTEPITVALLESVTKVLGKLDHIAFTSFIKHVSAAERIFIVGAGRSGLVGRFFCMRLMHVGKQAFIVGETSTPSIKAGDLLVAISGSGHTASVLNVANTAKEHHAWVVAITSNFKSPLHDLCDDFVRLERRIDTDLRDEVAKHGKEGLNVMPMGTLFELSTLFYLESVIGQMIVEQEIAEEEMKRRHANLE